jgi:hypothetical protein
MDENLNVYENNMRKMKILHNTRTKHSIQSAGDILETIAELGVVN